MALARLCRPRWPLVSVSRISARHIGSRASFAHPHADGPSEAKIVYRSPLKELPSRPYKKLTLDIDGESHLFSPLLLRDLCSCTKCVDPSTKQKLFSTVDIPYAIEACEISTKPSGVKIQWASDIPGLGEDHVTELDLGALRNLVRNGTTKSNNGPAERILWNAQRYRRDVKDIEYNSYMKDDFTLHEALQHLHSHGLLFLTNVPESEASVSTIAERIGPVKNTFYGNTWDVRSVPEAKNVAYTSQDLGFHMDLLYLQQPPHLQFLHCIRSSSQGGASLFADSFKAASDLYAEDRSAFATLTSNDVRFHYDHAGLEYYHQARKVFEVANPVTVARQGSESSSSLDFGTILDRLTAVSWSPPFQAPFAMPSADSHEMPVLLSNCIEDWHFAAAKFDALIHREDDVYERLMKPGECVIFDNRRVLHARRTFHVGDMGKERWLRGAYLDKDPYLSRMTILQERFGTLSTEQKMASISA